MNNDQTQIRSGMTSEAPLIPCHACGAGVQLARSVMLRADVEKKGEEFFNAWPDLNGLSPEQDRRFLDAYAKHERGVKFRRAFVCEQCYRRIDNYYGMAEVPTDNGPRTFNLAGESRGDRAAVYSFKKWLSFQRRVASCMGIEL